MVIRPCDRPRACGPPDLEPERRACALLRGIDLLRGFVPRPAAVREVRDFFVDVRPPRRLLLEARALLLLRPEDFLPRLAVDLPRLLIFLDFVVEARPRAEDFFRDEVVGIV